MKMKEISNYQKGRLGEELAKNYLEENGYEILALNFQELRFEIDIIAKKDEICFIEVKVIEKTGLFSLQNSVDYKKQNKIKKAAEFYINKNNLLDYDFQFDVIAVNIKKEEIYHYKAAF